jgi:chromosome segregation ATPase
MNFAQRLALRSAFMCMLETPKEGGGGGGKGTLEEQLTQAQTDLATANGSVQSLTTARDTAITERDTARNNATNLQTQFDALTGEATKLRTDLATEQGKVTALTTERDTLKTAGATKDARIKNLEALCNVKGLNPDAAPPAVEEPKPKASAEEFERRLVSAKSAEERAKITEEFEKAYAEGRVS